MGRKGAGVSVKQERRYQENRCPAQERPSVRPARSQAGRSGLARGTVGRERSLSPSDLLLLSGGRVQHKPEGREPGRGSRRPAPGPGAGQRRGGEGSEEGSAHSPAGPRLILRGSARGPAGAEGRKPNARPAPGFLLLRKPFGPPRLPSFSLLL